jgi:hypothetical protein
MEEIAPERTPLPCEIELKAVTTDASGRIQAPIYELNTPLGELLIPDIPKTLPLGSDVKLTVTIQNDFKIKVTAWITALSRDGSAEIDLPLRAMKEPDHLRKEFEILKARAEDACNAANPNVLFGDGRAKRLEDRIEDCRRMLGGQNVDVAKVQDRMDEIEGLIRSITQGWKPEPPKAIFDHAIGEATDLHRQVKQAMPETAKDRYDDQIEAIRQDAGKAWNAQNPAAWKEAYEKIQKLCDKLNGMIERHRDSAGAGSGGSSPKQDPAALLLQLANQLDALEKTARAQGKFAVLEQEFIDLKNKLKRISPASPNAQSEIWDWYSSGFQRLKASVERSVEEGKMRRAPK